MLTRIIAKSCFIRNSMLLIPQRLLLEKLQKYVYEGGEKKEFSQFIDMMAGLDKFTMKNYESLLVVCEFFIPPTCKNGSGAAAEKNILKIT